MRRRNKVHFGAEKQEGVEQRGRESLRLAKVMEWHRGWREKEEAASSGVQKQIRWTDGEKGVVPGSKERPREGQDGGRFGTGQDPSVLNLSERWLSESREEKLQIEAAIDTFQEAAEREREGSDGKVFAEEVDTRGGGFTPHSPLSSLGFPSLDAAAAPLSASSLEPYSSISGAGFGQTVKWTESDRDSKRRIWISLFVARIVPRRFLVDERISGEKYSRRKVVY